MNIDWSFTHLLTTVDYEINGKTFFIISHNTMLNTVEQLSSFQHQQLLVGTGRYCYPKLSPARKSGIVAFSTEKRFFHQSFVEEKSLDERILKF